MSNIKQRSCRDTLLLLGTNLKGAGESSNIKIKAPEYNVHFHMAIASRQLQRFNQNAGLTNDFSEGTEYCLTPLNM